MPLVVHYWADLQSVHGLRCYGNITRTRNVSEYMLVLALCLVIFVAAWVTAVSETESCELSVWLRMQVSVVMTTWSRATCRSADLFCLTT